MKMLVVCYVLVSTSLRRPSNFEKAQTDTEVVLAKLVLAVLKQLTVAAAVAMTSEAVLLLGLVVRTVGRRLL